MTQSHQNINRFLRFSVFGHKQILNDMIGEKQERIQPKIEWDAVLERLVGAGSEDRLGHPAISMNFKTESFTYVILLIFAHFVINLTFNFFMIG